MIYCEKLEPALKALKELCAEQKRYEKMRDKAFVDDYSNLTQGRIEKMDADLNFQAMHIRRCHKAAWKAICDAGLETSLTPETAKPSGFHEYEI